MWKRRRNNSNESKPFIYIKIDDFNKKIYLMYLYQNTKKN